MKIVLFIGFGLLLAVLIPMSFHCEQELGRSNSCDCYGCCSMQQEDYYPLASGKKWVLKGDKPDGERGPFTYAVEVVNREKVGDVDCFVVLISQGDDASRSWMRVSKEGVFIHKYEDKTFKNPGLYLKYPITNGSSWETELYGQKVKVSVIGDETIDTSIGKIKSKKVSYKGQGVDNTMFFAAGIGLVKIILKIGSQEKTAVLSDPGDIPCDIKYRWTFDNYEILVTSRDGEVFKVKYGDKEQIVKVDSKGLFLVNPNGIVTLVKFPLKEVTKWEVKELKASVEVGKLEKIEVPGGTFEAFPVESKELKVKAWLSKGIGPVKLVIDGKTHVLKKFERAVCFCGKGCKCIHCLKIQEGCYCDLGGCKCGEIMKKCKCGHCTGVEGGDDGKGKCLCIGW